MATDGSGAMKKRQGGQHEKMQPLEFNLTLLSQDTWTCQRGGSQVNEEQGVEGGVNQEVKRGPRAFPIGTRKKQRKREASNFLLYPGLILTSGFPYVP
jgi:hypothetical protein